MLTRLSRSRAATVLAGVVALSQTALAQNPPAAAPTTARPRVGLVLAGGGAKGAAHVGVLRVLDDLHIPVDCVVGTSMGALVGAIYASGTSPAEIERSILAIDWSKTVGGQGRRDQEPIKRKLATMGYANSIEVGLGHGVRMAGGLLGTQEIEGAIRSLVASARETENFDDLPIPFRAVATDMVGGKAVVLGNGDVAQAMRASMALPGVFAPVTIDGKVLSDGGLMDNLPVDVARKLCADVVIAVWMSTPPLEASDLTSALTLLTRSMDVMISANQNAQIASLGPNDIGIEVPMGDIGTADFQRTPEAVELGRKAAEARREDLRRLAVPEDQYRAWTARLGRSDTTFTTLSEVRIVGTNRVNADYVRAQLKNAVPGGLVSIDEITADTERVYALGDFERVDYTLKGPAEARVLEIAPVEKSYGPNFLHFDLGLAAYESGDMFALLRLDHDRTWINSRGAQWHNALQLGRQTIATTDFYQPFDVRQRFFVQPIALAEERNEDLYIDGDRVARYAVKESYGQADLGMNFGTRAQLRLGVRSGSLAAKIDTGVAALPELERTDNTTLEVGAFYDTRDNVALPTRGTFLRTRYAHSEDWLGGSFNYSMMEALLGKAFGVRGGDSLTFSASGGATLSGELPAPEQFQVGGIRTFPGLRPGELRGTSYWNAGVRYSWRLLDIQPLFGQALYAGMRLQAAEVRGRIDDVPAEVIYGVSGSIGARTPIGPLILSLGWVNDGRWQLQFTLGRAVAEGSLLDVN
jgi:NTE family protein